MTANRIEFKEKEGSILLFASVLDTEISIGTIYAKDIIQIQFCDTKIEEYKLGTIFEGSGINEFLKTGV